MMHTTERPLRLPIQLAGRVALAVSLIALLLLAAMLLLISDEVGNSYLQILQTYQYTRNALAPALIAAGLILLAVGGLIAWMVSLYGSFRIAGPLYRLQRNLEQALEQGPVEPVPIRRSDRLQGHAAALSAASARLRAHYAELEDAAGQAARMLDSDEDGTHWPSAVERLRDLDSRARL